jgi:hypothetical protein
LNGMRRRTLRGMKRRRTKHAEADIERDEEEADEARRGEH